jgi:hypothetical protein
MWRYLLIGVGLVILAVFGYFVWPTPWQQFPATQTGEFSSHPTRMHRVTGETQLFSLETGWTRFPLDEREVQRVRGLWLPTQKRKADEETQRAAERAAKDAREQEIARLQQELPLVRQQSRVVREELRRAYEQEKIATMQEDQEKTRTTQAALWHATNNRINSEKKLGSLKNRNRAIRTRLIELGVSLKKPHLYPGEDLDPETGDILKKERKHVTLMLDPETREPLGRWFVVDPVTKLPLVDPKTLPPLERAQAQK